MAFTVHEAHRLVYLTSPLLSAQSGLRHGFSTRRGGVSAPPFDTLNLGVSRGDSPADVTENYRRFCAAIGADSAGVVLSQQTHSVNIRTVTAADAGKGLVRPRDYTDVDGLITNVPKLALTVFSADCGMVLLYDPTVHCIGACHAGWRGCAGGIVEKTVKAMEAAYGAAAERLLAAVGPCIGQCCFETDRDVPEAMTAALGRDASPYLLSQGSKWHVDLEGLNRQWLLHAGLAPEHIDCCGLCTACHPDLFWSHRKMGNARGAQAAMIVLPVRGGAAR